MSCIMHALNATSGQPKSALALGIEEALKASNADDLWLEFGAWSGRTTRQIATSHKVISFDSFRGLPENWRNTEVPPGYKGTSDRKFDKKFLQRGAFDRHGKPPYQHPQVTWQVGWFNETLPPFLAIHPDAKVAFVHVDCDLYSSTSTVLTLLAPRLRANSILVFDELINYPKFEQHEMRALLEFQDATGRSLRVLGTQATLVLANTRDARSYETQIGSQKGLLWDGKAKQAAVVQVL